MHSRNLATAVFQHGVFATIARGPIQCKSTRSQSRTLEVYAMNSMLLQELSERDAGTITRVLFSMRDYCVETNSSLADLRSKIEGRNDLDMSAAPESLGQIRQRMGERDQIGRNLPVGLLVAHLNLR
jgi:hypothetical protein